MVQGSAQSLSKKSYQIGDKTVYLVPSATLYVVRTATGTHPFEILSVCLPDSVCSKEHIVDHYPEANVWVYKLPSDPNLVSHSLSVDQIKEKVRKLSDSRLSFIGSVWRDEQSQQYQLYTGNLFIRFDQHCTDAHCKDSLQQWGLRLKRALGFSKNTYFVEQQESFGFDAFDWATEIAAKKDVLFCQPELVVNRKSLARDEDDYHADALSTVTVDQTWVHDRVELTQAWQYAKGKGVNVCVIDDGIAADHPAFGSHGKIIASRDMLSRSGDDASHQHGSEIHGTACASVAVSGDQRAYGVAPQASLIAVRTKGLGSVLEAEAIHWAVSQGADVISCSWGPSDGDIDDPYDDFPSLPLPLHTRLALEHAALNGRGGKGCLVVFAAGNGHEPVALDSYASNPNVIAIGSTNKEDRLSRYSDSGEPLFCVFPSSEIERTDQGYKTVYGVTVADRLGAHGYSAGDYFSKFGGTSASAPGVAGVAALVLELRPELRLDQLKELLAQACEKIGAPSDYNQHGVSKNFGYGLLNANKAVSLARQSSRVAANLTALSHSASDLHHMQRVQHQLQLINTHYKRFNNDPTNSTGGFTVDQRNNTTGKKGYALHIGVDIADPTVYDDFRPLSGCVNDAKAMAAISSGLGYTVNSLHNADATRQRIKSEIQTLANTAKPGDLVLMSYAGHGSYVHDTTENADDDEPIDEVLVTYDGLLIDDEIYDLITHFSEGVRVVWVADCCHSESNLRGVKVQAQSRGIPANSRELPMATANKVLNSRKTYYQNIQRDLNRQSRAQVNAAVLAMYACKETELAQEFNGRGAFTTRIEDIFRRFKRRYDLKTLLAEVTEPLSGSQNPKVELLGSNFNVFSDGVFRLVGGEVNVPTGLSSNVDSTLSGGAKVNNNDESAKDTRGATFLIVDKRGSQTLELESDARDFDGKPLRVLDKELQHTVSAGQSGWDAAYQIAMSAKDADRIEFIEPDIISDIYQPEKIKQLRSNDNTYLSTYPNPEANKYLGKLDKPFIWHLDEKYSQLRPAFDEIRSSLPLELTEKQIAQMPLICHIDTGVLPEHPTLPLHFDAEKSLSFTRFGNRKDATDIDKKAALIENQGHGHGTISILAGNHVDLDQTKTKFKGYYGAFPYARVMTVKISEHVVLLSGAKFAKAIRHAIKSGASVVTMSMAGAPSRSMLKAINQAYEAGVVVVSAAGNCWAESGKRLLPKSTLYPARFNRVIGVTGATLDETPYLCDENRDWQSRDVGRETMQTCFGPKSVSKTNIAAYTPNVQWAGDFDGDLFNASGGGTSSATPQVAAAAAMYLYKYRNQLAEYEPEMRVEITRQALFRSAKRTGNQKFDSVFGTGMLKAQEALKLEPAELARELKPQKRDRLGWFISDDVFEVLFNVGSRSGDHKSRGSRSDNPRSEETKQELIQQMMRTELAQLCHLDPSLIGYDQETSLSQICALVHESEMASDFLKRQLRCVFPVEVSLSERKFIAAGESSTYSSHILEGEDSQRALVYAQGCGFTLKEKKVFGGDQIVEYELSPVATNNRSQISPSISLEMLDGDSTGALLLIEKDTETEEEILRWMTPELEKAGASRGFGSTSKLTVSQSLSEARGSRGFVSATRKLFVRLYRTATDQALSDRKGLIVGRIVEGTFVWQERTEKIDRAVAAQKNTVLLVHGTFSSAENAFDGLLDSGDFLQSLVNAGFGEYVLAYNMSTIRSSVTKNANDLIKRLNELGFKSMEDQLAIIAHSRGCLVARKAFSEKTRMALVAGTHEGTPMADGEHIATLINRVSNLAAITMAGTPQLAAFLSGMSRVVSLISRFDGLEDQQPGSSFIERLSKLRNLTDKQLLVGANFEPNGEILRRLDDAVLDVAIFGRQDNDGVTPLLSALANNHRGSPQLYQPRDTSLHHLNLFADEKVRMAILNHIL